MAPIRTFPLISDLVTDVSFNYEKAKQVPPLRLKPPEPGRHVPDEQEDIERGPGVPQVHRVLPVPGRLPRDPRPRGAQARVLRAALLHQGRPSSTCTRSTRVDRREFVRTQAGIGLCNITKCCTEVCPEHIHITDNAIIPLKERVADDFDHDPVAVRKSAGPQGAGVTDGTKRQRRCGRVGATPSLGRPPTAYPCKRLSHENPRVPGQGDAAGVRRASAATATSPTTPAEARAIAAAPGRPRRREGPGARGRPRQGRRRQAGRRSGGAEAAARQILGMRLKTPQTPPEGITVLKVLVEEASADRPASSTSR